MRKIIAMLVIGACVLMWAHPLGFAQEEVQAVEEEYWYVKEGVEVEAAEEQDETSLDSRQNHSGMTEDDNSYEALLDEWLAEVGGADDMPGSPTEAFGDDKSAESFGDDKVVEEEVDWTTKTLEEKLERTVDIVFTNANLTSVLSGISKLYDMNILVDKDVSGTVTINLKQISLKNGLSSLLKSNNYSYTIEDEMIKIVAYEELGRTEVLQLDFVSPDLAYDFVEKFVSEEGDLKINTSLNCLIMTDQSKNIERARELIEKIDLPPRQVLIEARLIDITHTDLSNLGISWTATGLRFGSRTVQDQIDQFDGTLDGPSTDLSGNQIVLGSVINNIDTTITLDALIQRQKAKVLASPSIIAINNVEAKINIGEKVPIREETQTTTGTTETTRFVDVGITLRVTPQISSSDYLQLVIHPEVSSVSTILDAGPRITTREADTTFLIKNRQTIVMAGLLQEEHDHNKGRVPILGSIPGFSWLFRNRATDTMQKELVIFITPYILPSPRDLVLSDEALAKEPMLDDMARRFTFMQLYDRAQDLEAGDNIHTRGKDYYGRIDEALHNYKELLSLYPDDPRSAGVQYRIGDIYYTKLKEYGMAREAFVQLLERYPESGYVTKARKILGIIERLELRESRRR